MWNPWNCIKLPQDLHEALGGKSYKLSINQKLSCSSLTSFDVLCFLMEALVSFLASFHAILALSLHHHAPLLVAFLAVDLPTTALLVKVRPGSTREPLSFGRLILTFEAQTSGA